MKITVIFLFLILSLLLFFYLHKESGFKEKFKFYDKKKPLYIYCRSGHRSSGAAEVLAEEGFTEIYELQGGILEWNKSK